MRSVLPMLAQTVKLSQGYSPRISLSNELTGTLLWDAVHDTAE